MRQHCKRCGWVSCAAATVLLLGLAGFWISQPELATQRLAADESGATLDADRTATGAKVITVATATDSTNSEADAAEEAKGFSIRGKVSYKGDPPPRREIDMKRDRECIKLHGDKPNFDEDLLVGEDGELENVFVYLRRGAPDEEYPIPEEPGVLDQRGCMYSPRVQGVLAGQTFQFKNSDPLLHNVRGFPTRNRPFNMGQKADSEPRERVFKRAERPIEVQCDVHNWMRGYIFVMDHPFFDVTGSEGTFEITGLPPGEYVVAAWHEKYRREQRQDVTIGGEDADDVAFTFEAVNE